MHLQLGFSTSSRSTDPSDLEQKLVRAFEYAPDAIELSLTGMEKMKHEWTPEILARTKKFGYRSLHAPVKISDSEWMRYPSKNSEEVLQTMDFLLDKCNLQTIVFHPDLVDDVSYLTKRYGGKLAFENLDSDKSSFKTVEDLQEIFSKAPEAKWVCDVNHVYTNDKTMQLSQALHSAFSDRLCHYHVSAYEGFHAAFVEVDPEESIILGGVLDLTKPLLHEGNVLEKEVIHEEMAYIRENLHQITKFR